MDARIRRIMRDTPRRRKLRDWRRNRRPDRPHAAQSPAARALAVPSC